MPDCVPQVSFAEEAECQWQWYTSRDQAAAGRAANAGNTAAAAGNGSNAEQDWQEVVGATQRVYVPTQQDMGRILRVTCTPSRYLDLVFCAPPVFPNLGVSCWNRNLNSIVLGGSQTERGTFPHRTEVITRFCCRLDQVAVCCCNLLSS
jgi:hypothetical protein